MEHFIKRLYACVIDFIVVFLLIAIVNNILFVPISLLKIPFLSAYYPYIVTIIITLAYFGIMEAKTNKTIGKMIMKLYVSDEEGYISYSSAIIRNITKCFWIPLIFDVIIGKILGFPSRLFDKIAGTDVYADSELELYDENSVVESNPAQYETENTLEAENVTDTPAYINKKPEPAVEAKPAEKEVEEDTEEVIEVNVDEKITAETAIAAEENAIKDTKEVSKTVTSENTDEKTEEVIKEDTAEDDKIDESEFIFADDTDIHKTYDNKKQKKDKKVKKVSASTDVIEESKVKEETPYEDEILDLIIEEEEESDSFVELTKDDF